MTKTYIKRKISNKSQLTSMYNRRDVESGAKITTQSNTSNAIINIAKASRTIECECNKPLHSRWSVKAIKVAKANNYDIVDESVRLFKLQLKYDSCDFDGIRREIQRRKEVKAKAKVDAAKEELARLNKIARIKAQQACSITVFDKTTLSGTFMAQRHASIVRMACS